MNLNFIYILGCIFLFFGLLWLLLPHVYHEQITEKIDIKNLETSHIIHILEGLILTLTGLALLVYYEKHQKISELKKIKIRKNYLDIHPGTKATKL